MPRLYVELRLEVVLGGIAVVDGPSTTQRPMIRILLGPV